ncbi:MAG: nuclear transport factor 2 family protein [Deltaproteobacteria bacterium]|nr:nuclear transport factor 2 family protein [Deltaproteobacteria bacterium]
MKKLEIAKRYLDGLRRADPVLVGSLFCKDGVIDDYTGGHHLGRSGIQTFIRTLQPGQLYVSEPETWLEEGDRLTLWGRIGLVDEESRQDVRWIFHFDSDQIAHLGNSRVDFFYTG